MSIAELKLLDLIQVHLRSGIGDILMPFFTRLGNGGMIWILLTLVLLLFRKTRRIGCAVGVSLLLEVLCCNLVLKPLVARIRPCDLAPSVQLLIPRPADFSFPSGHTASSFASASALYFSRSKLWRPAAVLSVIIAFSRLYLYVHYPSDVLAGALLGTMLGALGSFAVGQAAARLRPTPA